MDGIIEVTGKGTPVEVLRVGGAAAGVVLVPGVGGLDEPLRDYARSLRALGYDVAVPDLWWRHARPPTDTPEARPAALEQLVDSEALRDVQAALSCLALDAPRFVVGFSAGGLYARLAACTTLGLCGAVDFYGRIVYRRVSPAHPAQPLDFLPGLACPLQCHFGTQDPVSPVEQVDELERRLTGRGQPFQVFRYPGCGHGFLNRERPGWCAEEAATAWGRALNFIEQLAAAGPQR